MSRRQNLKDMPTEDLFALALQRAAKRTGRHVTGELQRRGTRAIFDFAASCCADAEPRIRCLGADILGQLGWGNDCFLDESIEHLRRLLDDANPDVLNTAAVALGHRHSRTAVPQLARLSGHPRFEVRLGVAFGLSCLDDPLALATLITLTHDRSRQVRNWATFGLARQTGADSDAIRAALIERLRDSDPEIRSEALEGLAVRRHPDAFTWIQAALAENDIISGYLEAAAALGDSALLPSLISIRDRCPTGPATNDYFVSVLHDAIRKCGEADRVST